MHDDPIDKLIQNLNMLDKETKEANEQFDKNLKQFINPGFTHCCNCGANYHKKVSGCSVCGCSFV
jgi:hypothetical protein